MTNSSEINRRLHWLQKMGSTCSTWPHSLDTYRAEAVTFLRESGIVLCSKEVEYSINKCKSLLTVKEPHSYQLVRALIGLQRMAANLLLFPWKQSQLGSVSCGSGFAVHTLSKMPGYRRILAAMGYDLGEKREESMWLLAWNPTDPGVHWKLQLLLIDLVAAELMLGTDAFRSQAPAAALNVQLQQLQPSGKRQQQQQQIYTRDPLPHNFPNSGIVCSHCRHIYFTSLMCSKCGKLPNRDDQCATTYL